MATIQRDPFANTADAGSYVPRIGTESALVNLEMALRDGARAVRFDGPPGSGKTLLLRVLEERLAGDFPTLRVPYAKLDSEEFCRWALDALSEAPAPDPERALAARIARGAAMGDPPLVWVIDDADLLPIPTLHTLLQLQRNTGEALRLLFACSGELPADEFEGAGVKPVPVELEGEMDRSETAHYVHARLVHAGADPRTRAEIESSLEELYTRSRGNPGRLHAAAAALMCFGPDRLAALAEEDEVSPTPSAAATVDRVEFAPAPAADLTPATAIAERASIESLVAEAVAGESPEGVAVATPALAIPTSALVAPPEGAPEPPRSEPPQTEPPQSVPDPGGAGRPTPRKRHRLRRLGRR
jgi:type II secretory pathway predicted ATPase ExeA